MPHLKHTVVVTLCVLALAGCSGSDAAPGTGSAAATPASPAPASSAPVPASTAEATPGSAAWQPADGLHVKVVVQLTDPVPPEACGDPGDEARVGVGSPVTLTVADGSVVSTQPLREVFEGQPYGPEGYTFGGWGDLEPDENGERTTFACFYVADFGDVPASDGYVASVQGGQDIAYDVPLLSESEGWITQLVS